MEIQNMITAKIKRIPKLIMLESIARPMISLFGSRDKRQLKYKVCICLIFYNEACFLKEWLDFHITIGVDHFYLYDNMSTDNYQEILAPYIEKGLVTLIVWPDIPGQTTAYQHCYANYAHETNWLGFIDTDEFVVPKTDSNIKSFLKAYDKYPGVYIPWLQFGTNGKTRHNYTKNVMEQYFSCEEEFSSLGKSFLNTRFECINVGSQSGVHCPLCLYNLWGIKLPIRAVNQYKHFAHSRGRYYTKLSRNKARIQVNHYYTKSLEFALGKTNRRGAFNGSSTRSINKIFEHDLKCTSFDNTIIRFVAKMKHLNG